MYFQKIKIQIEKNLNYKYSDIQINLQTEYIEEDFDFFLSLFQYKNKMQKSLLDIFEDFKNQLYLNKLIEKVFFLNGFLNIKLNRKMLIDNFFVKNKKSIDEYLKKQDNYKKVIILDYSSPNIAKNFSIGHLRSTMIGNALKNVYKKLGFKTISINHLGDWGTQFGKMILAYKKWAKEENILKNPIDELQRVYILFHEEAKKDNSLEEEAREIFFHLEKKDKEITDLWKWLKKISLKEFKRIYNLLGVKFDYCIGESFFHNKAIKLLKELKKKKMLVLDNQAYIMDLGNNILPALIQKKNTSTLYLTRDIACVLYRYKRFGFYKCLYIVGNEQKLHYQQLNLIVKKIGYDNLKLEHINFGLVFFKNMKISTRKSNDFKLIDIIKQTQNESKKIIKKRFLDKKKINDISLKIAVGSIIFNDLKNDRSLNIEFNLQKMLQFEGNTGPYLQYTSVRFRSILKKVENINNYDLNSPKMNNYYLQFHYYKLIRLIDNFFLILEKVKNKNMPSFLARYLFQLAKNANHFYAKERILNKENLFLQNANIFLIKNFLNVFEEGLNILGIPVLEEM
ncbi:MAG: arginine--tRNA ligase [Candidatus Phytoplasma stylosanthis]|nr:arginine--tRNA ligase [Candidatus Phytoplasma stylosanthis]